MPSQCLKRVSRNGVPRAKLDGSKMTCFNYNAARSDVKPRGDKGNVGKIEYLCSVR